MLFSYYAVLNAAIVAIAWVRAWRLLNLLGFGFTFVIGWLWGQSAYRPEHFTTTEPFLILFFLMYVVIPLLFARRRAAALTDYVDGTLVFGVPLVAFGLQVALVREFEYAAAWSALALAAFYMALAYVLMRKTSGSLGLIAEAYLALGVAFGTLALPLAFEGRLTSAAWALEGAAIVWIGLRQRRLLARAFGYALQRRRRRVSSDEVQATGRRRSSIASIWAACLSRLAGCFVPGMSIATAISSALAKRCWRRYSSRGERCGGSAAVSMKSTVTSIGLRAARPRSCSSLSPAWWRASLQGDSPGLCCAGFVSRSIPRC
jgi:uncharacterized membrane protein